MRLSVIIPAYNAEAYLRRCLASCSSGVLDGEAYEVIVVDDGSTDGTAALARSFRPEDPRVRLTVVSRPNGGLSAARNTGLSHASGTYVWFVDADDWIDPACLPSLLREAEGCDILAFGAADRIPAEDGSFREGTVFRYPAPAERTGPAHLACMSEKLKMCAPFYLFRRAFLLENGLRFREGLLHEDAEFTPRAVYLSGKIRVSVAVPYFRLVRPGSLSRTRNPRRITDLLSVVASLRSFLQAAPVDGAARAPFCSIVCNVANQAMKLSAAWRTGEWEIVAAEGLPAVFRAAAESKYRLEGRLLGWFPRHPVAVYAFLSGMRHPFRRKP